MEPKIVVKDLKKHENTVIKKIPKKYKKKIFIRNIILSDILYFD